MIRKKKLKKDLLTKETQYVGSDAVANADATFFISALTASASRLTCFSSSVYNQLAKSLII